MIDSKSMEGLLDDSSFPNRRRSSATSVVGARLARTLTFRSLRNNRDTNESAEEVRGKYGLNLLSSPSEPIVDFVFVHGLRGGSRKTWSKSEDSLHFWPKEWLPRDPDFRYVRIHSFGYNSDWAEKRDSVLNIHDFGKSLLGSLQDSPLIRRDASLPLVMIGHSMGGLVIKKAYILAKRDPVYHSIASRFHTLFFIATPHRGADSAQLLSNLLRAASLGSHSYVTDLRKNSTSTESINDEFRHVCDQLRLYSFYETLPTNLGINSTLIVEKDSAILGYAKERTAYINADHRGICKFDTPEDPNFLILRNAFISTIDEVVADWNMSKCEAYREQKRRLETFLGISKTPEDEYMHYSDLRAKGSCDWLIEKHSFQDWRDSGSSKIYWLSANPASGKSVLAAHVINHLEDANLTCSYFFFTRDAKSDSDLSNCLRSIAYQMALSNVYIRDNLLSMVDEGLQIAKDDFRAIWRKVFMGGIFRTVLYQPYFWVLDGLDECQDRHELIRKLGEIEPTYPLRIFVTSRPNLVSAKRTGLEDIGMHVEKISGKDSVDDIRLLIEANMDRFPAKDDNARQDLIEKIIDKAAGCFLWVKLVVDELREVYSPKDVKRILDSVPAGMDALYSRILKNMEQAQYGKEVAKAILTWTVLSARPLKVEELQAALELDIEDTVHNLEESVASICGHLVYVDAQSRVRMIHQTAREFLLQPNLESEFALKASWGHSRLAKVCLEYLRGDEMKAPRGRRSSIPRLLPNRSPFADYACSSFYEHIRGTSSSDGLILNLLSAFLASSNVLCWIENVAQSGNLNHLVRTGRILKDFLRRRINHASPLGNEFQNVNAWSIDLLRLVSKFGHQISIAPWSIYNLVPPFCPRQSALHKQFGTSSHCIIVKGLSAESWDDRISCHVSPHEQTSSIACTDGFYAVGYSSGLIVLYHSSACQLSRKMHHGEHIKSMKFSYSGKLLASGGMTNLQVFNVLTGERVLKLDTSHQCLALHFNNHDRAITAALRNNETMTWEIPNGSLLSSTKLVDQPGPGQQSVAARAPNAAAFSQELELLAVIFRAASIMLWDLQSDSFYGYCDRESKNETGRKSGASWPLDVVFNPAPNTNLLAATYWDGELVLFDPWEDEIKERTLAEGEVLACSPDGRTLATGDSGGNIQLFEFETLKLIYRINSWDYGIRSVAFSHDGLRFIDIRGSQCNIWEPSELIRQDLQDQNSDSDALSSVAKEIDLVDEDDLVMITAIAVHPQGRFVVCGKDDGSVCLYDAQTGLQHQNLYSHIQGVAITHLEFDMTSGLVASADASSTVMVYRISKKSASGAEGPIMRIRREEPISQLLIQSTRLLISAPSVAFLYSIDGQHLKSYSRKQKDTTSADSGSPGQILPAQDSEDTWRWLSNPVHPDQVILVDGNRAAALTMQFLEVLTNLELPPDPRPQDTGLSVASFPLQAGLGNRTPQTIIPCFGNQYLAMSSPSPNPSQPPSLYIWPFASSLSPTPLTTATHSRLSDDPSTHLSGVLSRILGSLGPKLIFLDRHNWVSSIELATDHYARHFFIPFDWLSLNNELLVQVTQTMVVFVKRNEIAVVRNAFGFAEYIPIE